MAATTGSTSATFESAFDFFYRRQLPPCPACGREIFRCGCEHLEAAHAAEGAALF